MSFVKICRSLECRCVFTEQQLVIWPPLASTVSYSLPSPSRNYHFLLLLLFFTCAFLPLLGLFLSILARWTVDTRTRWRGLASNFKSKSLSSLSTRTTKNIKTIVTDGNLKGSDNANTWYSERNGLGTGYANGRHTLLAPLERANLNHWGQLRMELGSLVLFRIPDNRLSYSKLIAQHKQ
jgi:hypothetical protein